MVRHQKHSCQSLAQKDTQKDNYQTRDFIEHVDIKKKPVIVYTSSQRIIIQTLDEIITLFDVSLRA